MGTVSEFAEETVVELALQQEKLDRLGKDINNFFEELLSNNNIPFCSVNVRTKTAKSLKEKIYRKNCKCENR